MAIKRSFSNQIKNYLFKGKTLIITGPRQVGKTTLIKTLLKDEGPYLFLDGDDSETRQLLSGSNTRNIERIIGNFKIVFIDEAQRINDIGLTAKIIHDQFEEVQLIMSGSSSFDLNIAINEPLTGRKIEFSLFPISWKEIVSHVGYLAAKQDLNNRLIYGMYPDIITHKGEEQLYLKNLTESYLYKDILSMSKIQKPEVLEKLLQALAYQIGSEVSFSEISNMLGVSKETVASYIKLLEKTFVVFKVNSYSKNLRNEIKTNKKIYFYDNGIRNAIIKAFNPIDLRPDKGALWENFLISERIKHLNYQLNYPNFYFWRSKDQQEVDWIEESDLKLKAFEFKWKDTGKFKFPKKFKEAYHPISQIIDMDNFNEFLLDDINASEE
ncbi:MAG: ATP-binding protein [Bacteroidia bacterium]